MKALLPILSLILSLNLHGAELIQLTPLEESSFKYLRLDTPNQIKVQLTIYYTEEGQKELADHFLEIVTQEAAIRERFFKDEDKDQRKKLLKELITKQSAKTEILKNKYAKYHDLTQEQTQGINSLTIQTRDKLTELLNSHTIYESGHKAFKALLIEQTKSRNELLRRRYK